MSEYLSTIATRGIDALSALPPNMHGASEPLAHSAFFEEVTIAPRAPAYNGEASGPMEQTTHNIAPRAVHTSITPPHVHTSNETHQHVIQPTVKPVYTQEKTGVQRDDVMPYIAGHVDRLIAHENNTPHARVVQTATHTAAVTTGTLFALPANQHITAADVGDVRDHDAFEPAPAKTSTEKSSAGTPWSKRTPPLHPRKTNVVARLMPEVPQPAMQTQAGNSSMASLPQKPNAAPRLVIGKITVEVMPPVAPPQKIITRTVQTSSSASQPKNNRLGFGLGQL